MFYHLLKIGFRNLAARKLNSVAAVFAFSGVIFIFAMMSSLSSGLSKMGVAEQNKQLSVIVKSGVQSEALSNLSVSDQRTISDVLSNKHNITEVSFEAIVSVNVKERDSGEFVPTPLRGITNPGITQRQASLVKGRWFVEGSDEIVVGQKAEGFYADLHIGDTVELGKRSWRVVGIFDAKSPSFNGEIWSDLSTVQSAYNRGASVQTVYFTAPLNVQVALIKDDFEDLLSTSVESLLVSDFVAKQMAQLKSLIDLVIIGLSSIMFIGLLFGGISIMEANFSYRHNQFSMLLSLGVLKHGLISAIMAEGALLGLLSGIAGVAIAALVFNGQDISTSTQSSHIIIEMHTSAKTWLMAITIASVLGFLSAGIPSLKLSSKVAN